MERFEHLFSPIKIKNLEVKNHIFMSAIGTFMATKKHEVTDETIAHYEARARGGVGFITTEVVIIDKYSNYSSKRNLGLYDDTHIEGMRRLADAVHAYGAKIAPQLFHVATAGHSSLNEGYPPVAASPIAMRRMEIPRPLTLEEIPVYVEKFGEAARRAKEAGCDAVEVHCCHKHGLLGSFLSPLHNKRIDAYGGNVDGRLRLPLEVIRKIIDKVGPDFPIIVRMSVTDMEPGGQSIVEACYIAKRFEDAGVSMLNLSNGGLDNPWNTVAPAGTSKAFNADLAERIKKVVHIPVGVIGRNNEPWVAEMVLATGKADVAYMGRALLCDPDLPNKAQEGKVEDIRPCIGCQHCISHLAQPDSKISCVMNPFAGRGEKPVEKAEVKKRVLIVGGGPGGLEAATIAAQRGHDVTLMEKSDQLGGQAYIAAFPPCKQDVATGMKYMIEQTKKAGVKIELNCEATPDNVKAFKADAVIVATGGKPIMPKWMCNSKGNVVSAWDALEGKCNTGNNILVIGGGAVGCETADFLAHPYDDRSPNVKRVTVVELTENILVEDYTSNRSLLVRRMQEKGISIMTGVRVEEILEDGIRYSKNGEEGVLQGFDTIVSALGTQSNNDLTEVLGSLDIAVYTIGDAGKPGKMLQAIAEAADVAQRI